MDQLQDFMENNFHLKNPQLVYMHIQSITMYWAHLSEEDRDYIHGAEYALEEQMEWNLE